MEGRKRKNRSGEEQSLSKRSRSSSDWTDTSIEILTTGNVQDPIPSTSGITRHSIQKYVRGNKEETEMFDDNGTDNSSTDPRAEVEAAGRGTHADPGDIYERSYDDKYEILPGRTDEEISPRRDWTSSRYTGSVKGLKRVKRKLFRETPSPDMAGRTRISEHEKLPSTPYPKGRKLNTESSSSEESSLKRPRETPSEFEQTTRKRARHSDDSDSEEDPEQTSINKGRGMSRKKSGSKFSYRRSISSNGNISGPATGPRRSTRLRVPPLEAWRNERLIYKLNDSGELECMGIDRGTKADNSSIAQMRRKQDRLKNYKKKAIEKSRSVRSILTKVKNPDTGRLVQARVHRPFKSLEWSNSPDQVRPPPYTIAKAFSSNSISFGFLEVAPFSTTGIKYSQRENIHICVIKGHLEMTVQERKFLFNSGDTCIVPFGVPYSITNCSNSKGQVSFCNFQEPFFPYQHRR